MYAEQKLKRYTSAFGQNSRKEFFISISFFVKWNV